MYYLYHIPGKKIGVTCNLNKRVTLTQGYGPDEYEVLDQSFKLSAVRDINSNAARLIQQAARANTKKYSEPAEV